MIKVTLNNKDIKEYKKGIPIYEIAKNINSSLAKNWYTCEIDGKLTDIRNTIDKDCNLKFLTFDDDKGKKVFWHSSAHLLAHAVKKLYPNTKLAIGPAIENGFYYDFEVDKAFTPTDLKKIEKEMGLIVKQNPKIQKSILSKKDAIELMSRNNETYKIELINEIASNNEDISFYTQGDFTDLCSGPHILNLSSIKAFKLTQTTGAYWRGDSKNTQLSRIYGVSFPKTEQLEKFLKDLEEAKKRDHNLIGRQLGYFTTSEHVGQGLPLLMPKGAKTIQILQRFVEDECEKRGYVLTKTPIIAKNDLYKISGHWDHYRDGMFIIGDVENHKDDIFALRPMTCPFQFMIYNSQPHSYKELPIRYSENSILCRNEASGEMHGLIRIRQFTLSDAHIVVTPEQLEEEFGKVVNFIKYMMEAININNDITFRFSKWDPINKEKYIDNPHAWETTQNQMRNILNKLNIDFVEADDEAAFYGPKLDIQMKNIHGKEDTIITIQIDFALAERFGMTYIDADSSKKYPFIIHHSIIGCYERTLALLLEKYAGDLPTWIAPIKARILPISEHQFEYCKEIQNKLNNLGISTEFDSRNEKIGYKIRESQLDKTPYMLIIGDKELESNSVSVRSRKHGEMGSISIDEFKNHILLEINNKK